ncbi:3360_t:CDS:2 [Rhizophagus irregularis]|nr:3360_t:CDS:2 [Rhizophagus irregularis]
MEILEKKFYSKVFVIGSVKFAVDEACNWKIIVEIANDKDETSVEQKLGDIGERLKSTAPVDPKTLTSLLASSILQPPAVKVPSHKFYDRNQAKKSMLKVARLERLNDVWESSEETNMHQNQIQYNINYNNSRHTQAIKELG